MPFWPPGELLGGGQDGRPTRVSWLRGFCSLVAWRAPPRFPVWLPLDQTVTYFITVCVADRLFVLNNPEVFGAILKFCDLHQDW